MAPQNLTAVYTGSFSVQLTLAAIAYQADPGRYEVAVSPSHGGPRFCALSLSHTLIAL